MSDSNPVSLVPSKSDREIAAEIRQRLEVAFVPILDIINEANSHSIGVNFQIGRNQTGKLIINFALIKDL